MYEELKISNNSKIKNHTLGSVYLNMQKIDLSKWLFKNIIEFFNNVANYIHFYINGINCNHIYLSNNMLQE